MTGGQNHSLEGLLRERLHEVDAIDPPEPDFEFRALRAGRDELKRRQSWRRGLLGAAAAVVIGALAVPAIGRLQVSSSGGASSAQNPVAAQDRGSNGSDAGAGQAAKESAGAAGGSAPSAPSTVGVVVPYAGSTPVDWDSAAGKTALADAQGLLSGSQYAATFTAVSIDRSATPRLLVVHLTRLDPKALLAVVGVLPPDAPIGYAISAFSAQNCQQTGQVVENDRATLTRQGYAVGAIRCDDDGRVVVAVTNLVTAEQIKALEARYGDAVRVEQVVLPTTP